MNHLSIRFLIGLRTTSDTDTSPPVWSDELADRADTRARLALAILSTHYPAFSSHRGVGYWQGAPEPNLVVEVIVDAIGGPWDVESNDEKLGRAQSVAGEIALALDQESVALAIGPVRFTLEGPHATEG